jgi:hypothetical protein
MTIQSLDLAALRAAVLRAARILAAYPVRLGAATLLVFLGAEALGFVPGIGFLLKLGFGSLFFAQILALFDSAARGRQPSLLMLVQALSLPMSSQFALVLAEWGSFGAGLLFLWLAGGPDAALALLAPASDEPFADSVLLFEFKIVLYGAGAVLTFLSPVLVLVGARGAAALQLALRAAWRNLLFVVLLAVYDIVLEAVLAQLAQLGSAGAFAYLGLLLGALLFELALLYTVSAQVFGLTEKP